MSADRKVMKVLAGIVHPVEAQVLCSPDTRRLLLSMWVTRARLSNDTWLTLYRLTALSATLSHVLPEQRLAEARYNLLDASL